MQGLVTLDFGNSHPHAGLFRKAQGEWTLLDVVPLGTLAIRLDELGLSPHNASLALCEVKSREEELMPFLQQGFLLTRLKDYWRGSKFAGMPVDYAKTLGEDRLILAHHSFKTRRVPTLIIDAGTFVTMDVVTERGLEGGYILPGLAHYFSIFRHGDQLKDVTLLPHFSAGLPHDTAEAMTEGYKAFAALAKKLLLDHQIQRIILTGSLGTLWESFFLEEKARLEVESNPHLIHWAIQHWMTTQIEPL